MNGWDGLIDMMDNPPSLHPIPFLPWARLHKKNTASFLFEHRVVCEACVYRGVWNEDVTLFTDRPFHRSQIFGVRDG